jgi:hypothetical protein
MIPIIKVPWEGPPTPRYVSLSMARIFLRLHENLGIILKANVETELNHYHLEC